jgi:hypothetical protein
LTSISKSLCCLQQEKKQSGVTSQKVSIALLIMLLKWNWRGILWIVLGAVGVYWAPTANKTWYDIGVTVLANIDSGTRGELTYQVGLYVVILGFLMIVGGGIWDIIQKRKARLAG